jgi:ribosomal protein S18 acetylase RimI-like enzyme
MTSLAPTPALLSTRAAAEADIPLLRQLAERIWRASYSAMLTPAQIDYMLAWMYSPEQIAQELREGVIWEMALVEEQPVGFFSVTFEDGARAKLNKIYVVPERQGQGLGRALLTRAEEIAAAHGAREMWLQVNKRNERARRTYERAGYAIERSAVFEIGSGFVMDDFLMTRALPAPSTT